jgi:hypothetical protein
MHPRPEFTEAIGIPRESEPRRDTHDDRLAVTTNTAVAIDLSDEQVAQKVEKSRIGPVDRLAKKID